VGKNEHSPSNMRRTKVASRKLSSGCMEAICAQIVTDLGFPLLVAGGLLHDNPLRRHFLGDTSHLGPKGSSIAIPVNGCSDACTLAGRPSDEEFGTARYSTEGAHIVVDGHSWEARFEETAPLLVDLNELHCAHPDDPETERMGANVAEEAADIHARLIERSPTCRGWLGFASSKMMCIARPAVVWRRT
jgi:hypothetical protein